MLHADTHTLAKLLGVDWLKISNKPFSGICTDTRKPMHQSVFLALKGTQFDAHNYTHEAEKMGAVALIVQKPVTTKLPCIQVKNTQAALAKISHWHLKNIRPKVVAITGSNGKTTTKNMLREILKLSAPTLATKGNLNNHLGVPMTLLELNQKHQYAVIEMGANHLGEIAHLCKIAPPDIAVITNATNAHLGEFGSVENLAKTKAEIYQALGKKGIAIINNDSEFADQWRLVCGTKHHIYFGSNSKIYATHISNSDHQVKFTLHCHTQRINVCLNMIGEHHINNALAAASCAYALGVDIEYIKTGLEKTTAENGRLNLINCKQLTLIDDSYNANPESMKVAINTLCNFQGEKICVLGTMAELGKLSKKLHQQVGNFAQQSSLDGLYTYGRLAHYYGGIHFDDLTKIYKYILQNHPQATVLIKGSRVAQLDRLVKLFTNTKSLCN